MSESSKPAELRASSSFSLAIPEDALRNGTRSVAVAKEIEGSGMEALPVLIAYQYCRKFGSYVTFSGGSRQRRERRALPPQKKKKKKKKKKGKKKHVDLVHDSELKRDPYEDTDVEVDGRFKRAN